MNEIKISVDSPLPAKTDIGPYKFHHTLSLTSSDGIGFYVKSNLIAN